jgi:hypothetical protein
MKKYTIEDIRKLDPKLCYDPAKYLAEDWQGTLIDMLQVSDCPAEDRIYVVTSFLDDKTNRSFAVACAREALKLVDNPDQRSVAACDVAERFVNGEATEQELAAARDAAAWAAASADAWADAWDDARDKKIEILISLINGSETTAAAENN